MGIVASDCQQSIPTRFLSKSLLGKRLRRRPCGSSSRCCRSLRLRPLPKFPRWRVKPLTAASNPRAALVRPMISISRAACPAATRAPLAGDVAPQFDPTVGKHSCNHCAKAGCPRREEVPRPMSHALPALAIVGILCVATIVLLAKFFWPARTHDPDEANNWEQRNDLRAPSLERLPEATDTSVDAAVASQILGID